MDWHRLAVKLGKTVRELQTGRREPMRSWEWMLWRAFLLLEPNLFDKQDYYFAALTAEVARGHSKSQRGTSLKDRLIKFVVSVKSSFHDAELDSGSTMKGYETQRDNVRTPDGRIIPPHIVARMRQSKGMWFGASGLDKHGKVRDTGKRMASRPLPKHVKRGRY